MEHKSVDCDDIKEAPNLSESKEAESSYDEHESDYDSSDCSITSGLQDDCLHKAITITSFSDMPAVDVGTLQADESANTVWTDDKHASYLDLIEATFIRKMYSKEYCSLDVCGHSSQSSISWELECVESHPFCLNMRKPHEQHVGRLPFRDSTRSLLSTPSVLASPWIQHFKAKQVVSATNSKAEGNTTKTEAPSLSASTENLQKLISTVHDTISNTDLLKSNRLVSKKRAALFDSLDCMQPEVYSRSSHGVIAGGFKRLKSQHALSQMDMVMEKLYNIEQQNQENAQQNEGKVPSDVNKEDNRMPKTSDFEEADESTEVPQPRIFKEKQPKTTCMEIGLGSTMLSKELL